MYEQDVCESCFESISECREYVELETHVSRLLAVHATSARAWRRRRVWMISSTSRGGGVAEMMPRIVALLRDMGVDARWLILQISDADRAARFFALTKHIHNNIHGADVPLNQWQPAWAESMASQDRMAAFRELFEGVAAVEADQFFSKFCPDPDPSRDIIIVHDPQPAAMIRALKQRAPDVMCVWRCHIGLDVELPATLAAWRFLRPYLEAFDHSVFSAQEYIPSFLRARASIIHPGVSPLARKNKWLSPYDVAAILRRAGLVDDIPGQSSHVLSDRYEGEPARVFGERGAPGFLQRPVVTQISRWDRLKGWDALVGGWIELKTHTEKYSQQLAWASEKEMRVHDPRRHRDVLEAAVLVLAGPDPRSIADDPEGLAVLEELKTAITKLPADLQEDIRLIELPMGDADANALLVNAIQRCSSVIVQNSLREGFGLTATEALLKRVCFVGTEQACGLRTQARHLVDGILVHGDASVATNVADALNVALGNDLVRDRVAVNGQRRAYEDFLVFSQIQRWLKLCDRLLGGCGSPAAAAAATAQAL